MNQATIPEFLEFAFGTQLPVIVSINASKEDAKCFTSSLKAIRRSEKARSHGLYYTKSSAKNPSGSWGIANFNALHTIVLDDIPEKAPRPQVTPSFVIESSEGNEQWVYVLDTPITDFEYAQRFDAAFYTDDPLISDRGCKGVMHLMRLPGGVNDKPTRNNFPVRCLQFNDIKYSPDKLLEAFGVTVSDAPVRSMAVMDNPFDAVEQGEYPEDELLTWMAENNYLVDGSLGGGFMPIRCPFSDEHTGGKDDARYSPLGVGDLPHIRGFKCYHEHCKDRKSKDFIVKFVDEGAPKVPVNFYNDPEKLFNFLKENYVAITEGSRVANLCTNKMRAMPVMRRKEFLEMYPQKDLDKKNNPSVAKTFLESSACVKLRDTRYKPSHDRVMDEDNEKFFNVFQFPEHKNSNQNPDVFLNHLEHLIPSDEEREYFLDWIAAHIKTPGRKLPCVLIVGAPGTGKSWVSDMLGPVLGEMNVGSSPYEVFMPKSNRSQYDDWMVNRQLIVMEEVYHTGVDYKSRMEAYNNSKEICGTSPFRRNVNEKSGRQYSATIYANVLMFSNHDDALILPLDDRRTNVFQSNNEPLTDEHKQMIWEDCYRDRNKRLAEAARIYYWLMQRTITHDLTKPIDTPARQLMMQSNESPIDEIFSETIAVMPGTVCTKYQFLQLAELRIAPMLEHEWDRYFPAVLGRMFNKLNVLRPENRNLKLRLSRDESVRVRILRDIDDVRVAAHERGMPKVKDEVYKNGAHRDGLGSSAGNVFNLKLRDPDKPELKAV